MTPTVAEPYLRLPRRRYFSALEWHAVGIGTVAAVVLLGGYGFGLSALISLIPGFPTMKFNTAAAIMALSVGYVLSLRNTIWTRRLSIAIAAALMLWLAWARANWAVATAPGIFTTLPSDATIFCIFASALALLLLNIAPRLALPIAGLAILAATPALFRILGLVLFWGAPDPNSPMNSMALHTATLIAWFNLVCIALHPALGFARAILQSSLRGRLLRRALPVVVGLPVIAAAVSLAMRSMFGWAVEALFALNATISVTTGAVLIWWLSRVTERWQAEATEQTSLLVRANEALEQYASSAAHDLKAPARHVLLYGQLLDEALAKEDLAGARRHAKSLRQSAQDMPKMIDGMLEYSRSAFTRVSISEAPLSEMVQAAATQLGPELGPAGARITLARDAVLRCDPTLVTSVFQNLFANAFNNRRRDRPLMIKVDCVEEAEVWRITVEDNGPGFDAEFAAVAFNPLARGQRSGREGMGIGLATCRTVIRSHGGDIRIDQDFRNGARIEFTLPRRPPET